MSLAGATRLYTPDLLALAIRLAEFPLDCRFDCLGSARSVSCGSSLEVGALLDKDQKVTAVGIRAKACAVGQAAATIFAVAASGKSADQIARALRQMEEWLAGGATRPDWPGVDQLDMAREHRGRHGAILLPWRAAAAALCNAPTAG